MDRLLNVMTLLSLGLIVLVLASVRRSHIRVEYSVSWLGAAAVMLVLSRSRGLLEWLAVLLGLRDIPLALVMLALCVFVVVFYRFSVVISGLRDANIALTQRVAILEFQLRALHEGQ